ncbi:MAG: gamma-glutamyltransferase [Nitrososphaerota archaeon]|nr:gamma-glutamyltransferase [Nitrososphaerota archaeon]
MSPPITGRNGVVTSAHPLASAAGLSILKAGGNAIDAAVATSLVLGVVAPAFSGVGGGGFMLIQLRDEEALYIDYRETAPRRARPGMFTADSEGNVKGFANSMGYASVGVPGTVAGLSYALENYGRMKFPQVAAHAISFAKRGFRVSPFVGTIMSNNVDNAMQKFKSFPETRKQWLKDDRPFRSGDKKTVADFARVLEHVSKEGRDGFYNGWPARAIADDMAANGGLIDEEDLAGYSVQVRRPVKGTYRGLEVRAMPPPSFGGIAIVELLNILEDLDITGLGLNTAETISVMAKALGAVWPDLKRKIGDPDFIDVDTPLLTSKDYAAKVWFGRGERGATADRTGRNWTTHLSVVDKERNVAAITESIECYFGSGVIAPGTGFFLNDTMHDFDIGRKGPNSIAPGKRPVSNMTPTLLLKDSEPYLVTGSAAGPRIVTATLQSILNVVDHSLDIQAAVDAPRFHYQGSGPLKMESRIGPKVRARVREMGFESENPNYVQLRPGFDVYFGGVNAVLVGKKGELRGGADTRRQGGVAAY